MRSRLFFPQVARLVIYSINSYVTLPSKGLSEARVKELISETLGGNVPSHLFSKGLSETKVKELISEARQDNVPSQLPDNVPTEEEFNQALAQLDYRIASLEDLIEQKVKTLNTSLEMLRDEVRRNPAADTNENNLETNIKEHINNSEISIPKGDEEKKLWEKPKGGSSLELKGNQLARRLGVSGKTVHTRKLRADFPSWSQEKDPDGFSWEYNSQQQIFSSRQL